MFKCVRFYSNGNRYVEYRDSWQQCVSWYTFNLHNRFGCALVINGYRVALVGILRHTKKHTIIVKYWNLRRSQSNESIT